MATYLSYQRHRRREFWINLFLAMPEIIGIDYDSLREKEVIEFFYLMKEYDRKLKSK
jgi:hypothetical protein